MDMSLGDTTAHWAARLPQEALAVSYPDATLSWAELDARVVRRARRLQAHGVGHDDRVVVALPNSTRFHEVCLALWKLGATPCVVSPRLPPAEFEPMMALIEPKLIVGATAALTGRRPRIDDDGGIGADDSAFAGAVAPSWKAMGTGGSTGRPKVIVDHTPGRVDQRHDDLRRALSMNADAVVLNPGPLSHNAPFLFAHVALFYGCPLIGMAHFDAEEALRLIERHRVTWVNFAPTMMHRIAALPQAVRDRYDVSSLRSVWHMAAPCAPWQCVRGPVRNGHCAGR